ncbi:MAG: dipeptidase [Vicinamibacterales bacterium]|jgi:membrane dipeptidase|nr:membrane dipeptidase [Acidobacteriota bacterium]MDP6372040.1 dipeptidase [Vicinamibacterales bacterium]MBU24392.1 membrane dipeptidase [Acidobacteriota bacterium]MDP6610296.1 dipeptidase [Vicinamibacterales bacterium]MDP7338536.1 dipeptidase [Vicinamibacterales bacterium]|tara:strand:- start:1621 stop:2853 length:1233 start_codon:yes stop_codon:yes gene_type:complete
MRLIQTAVLSAAVSGVVLAAAPQQPAAADAEAALRARAERLHREAIVLDTHADLTPFIQKDTQPVRITDPGMAGPTYVPADDPRHQPIRSNWMSGFPAGPWRFTERHTDGYMDLPRIREGGLDAEFFAIYMEREPRPGMAVTRALAQIESIHALAEKYPDEVALATSADDVRAIAGSGRLAALIGIEGGYMIEDDLRVLRMFHALGARYMSLTHSFNTHWADSSGTGRPVPVRHEGLSPFGVEVVKEMNRLGMMIDISHVADSTFFDALAVTEAPVIASHSSVDGVMDHARNMSDAMLRALAENGGVIQINAVIKYIDPVERDRTPISVFIDHIAHAIEVAGPDHVGIGLDYGYDAPAPDDLEDISQLGNVTYELLKRGYDDETVRKVLGANTLRVMQEVEEVAARLGRR